MIQEQLIRELKKQHGDHLFSISMFGKDYVFRPLTVAEYRHLVTSELPVDEKEDLIVSQAVVWPEDLSEVMTKAGIVSSLASEILEYSDFFDVKSCKVIFDNARLESNDIVNIMKALILAVHQEFNLNEEDIDKMTFSQLATKAALAEQILTIKKVVNDPNMEFTLEIVDPEEAKAADRAVQQQEFEKAINSHDPDLKSTLGTAPVSDPLAAKLQAGMQKAKEQGLLP